MYICTQIIIKKLTQSTSVTSTCTCRVKIADVLDRLIVNVLTSV